MAEPTRKTAMISSTAVDLPEHRQQAIEACQRQGIFPIAMEHLPARDADAISVSLKMVDQADLYIGIYAWRYGYVPDGHAISITEMEFDRAVQRGIPILVFTSHRDHLVTSDMVEADKDAQARLAALKARACQGRGRMEFQSPTDLRSHLVQSLGALLQEEATARQAQRPLHLHPSNLIPTAPAPYIAHPYALLHTSAVIGRREELSLLTDWVTSNRRVPSDVRLFTVVAIGGMGKSALTWKWFNDIAPNELPHLAGRLWWSFDESDASFENFVIRTLAYTAGLSEAEVRQLPAPAREEQLWRHLDQQPFLLVLDGLERLLLAYARMDAAHLADDGLDEQTANDITRFYGLPDSVKETYLAKHRLRQCADPRAGRFLRRLTQVRASRVLISTRLYPAELQTPTAHPWLGCYPYFLTGLSDEDALALWRALIGGERSGTSAHLLPLFRAFDNYPLLLRALASEVAEYRPAPGDFERWHQAHPDFNPVALPLHNARTHVLTLALQGLRAVSRQVLHTIAAFRMPARWETLHSMLVGEGKLCKNTPTLEEVLRELEDRGLIGWDRLTNRYGLHPIVQGVIWTAFSHEARQDIYKQIYSFFETFPRTNWTEVRRLEDLEPYYQLFTSLVGLGRQQEAEQILQQQIELLATHIREEGGAQ